MGSCPAIIHDGVATEGRESCGKQSKDENGGCADDLRRRTEYYSESGNNSNGGLALSRMRHYSGEHHGDGCIMVMMCDLCVRSKGFSF